MTIVDRLAILAGTSKWIGLYVPEMPSSEERPVLIVSANSSVVCFREFDSRGRYLATCTMNVSLVRGIITAGKLFTKASIEHSSCSELSRTYPPEFLDYDRLLNESILKGKQISVKLDFGEDISCIPTSIDESSFTCNRVIMNGSIGDTVIFGLDGVISIRYDLLGNWNSDT